MSRGRRSLRPTRASPARFRVTYKPVQSAGNWAVVRRSNGRIVARASSRQRAVQAARIRGREGRRAGARRRGAEV